MQHPTYSKLPDWFPLFLWSLVLAALLSSCTKDAGDVDASGYPKKVGSLLLTKCATTGCHTTNDRLAAGGLSLSSYAELLNGTSNGAALIPSRIDHSPLLFFTNVYPELGICLKPTMPVNQAPLSREEYLVLRDWIAQGCMDANGNRPFQNKTHYPLFYVSNQGCDLVTTIDAAKKINIDAVDVGAETATEAPHMIKVSPNRKYWYTCLTAGKVFQKFSTQTNLKVGEVQLGDGAWNVFALSDDNQYAFIADFAANGRIAVVDVSKMLLIAMYASPAGGSPLFSFPHGLALTHDTKTLYVTAQNGNFIYKVNLSNITNPDIQELSLQPGLVPSTTPAQALDPHELLLSADQTRLFVTCQKSNELRIWDVVSDQLVASVPVNKFPQEMALDSVHNRLWITCTEDNLSFANWVGSISVVDITTQTQIASIKAGYQPHGIALSIQDDVVAVANRNINIAGPAPHHSNGCGGRNGYLTFYNLLTMQALPTKIELAVDPYSVAFKPAE